VPARAVAQGNVVPIVTRLTLPFKPDRTLRPARQNAVGIKPGDVVSIMGAARLGSCTPGLPPARSGRVIVRGDLATGAGRKSRCDRAVNRPRRTWHVVAESPRRGADVVIVAALPMRRRNRPCSWRQSE
jgi:hypothetical protein